MLENWRNIEIGTRLRFYGNEFDGSWDEACVVKEKYDDHLIADMAGVSLWIDDGFADMFKIDEKFV